MTHVLHLDSSARRAGSVSRQLGQESLAQWLVREPDLDIVYRDLDAEPPPFVNDTWVSAAFSPPEGHDRSLRFALSRSELLIRELEVADVLLIGAPMYNFGIPAALKAWIDQVVRLGRTFHYEGPVPVGLVHGKHAIVLATSGGNSGQYELAGLDFRTSYLRAILGFMGITSVEVVSVVDTMSGHADLAAARAEFGAVLDRQALHIPAQTEPVAVPPMAEEPAATPT